MSEEFGTFMRTIGKKRVLTAAEEQDLTRRAHAGDRRAHDLMVEHNTRLVISICKKYGSMGFDLEDLVQEGVVGLLKAVERFDPDRGFKFSTYATWWIKQAVHRYMAGAGGGTIHMPARLQKVRRELRRYMSATNCTLAEAAKALEVEPEVALDAMEGPRVTASLDASIGTDGTDEGRHSQIADPGAVDPAEIFQDNHVRLKEALSELPELQRRVLELRYGFDGEPVRGGTEVAEILDVPKKAVQAAQRGGLVALKRIYGRDDWMKAGESREQAELNAAFDSFEEQQEPEVTCRRDLS